MASEGWRPGKFLSQGAQKAAAVREQRKEDGKWYLGKNLGHGATDPHQPAVQSATPPPACTQPEPSDTHDPASETSSSKSAATAPAPQQTNRFDPAVFSTPFYLNIVVVDSSAAVEDKVGSRLGSNIWGRTVTHFAKCLVTESTVAGQVATQLVDRIPQVVGDMGITLSLQKKYQRGPFVVLKAQVQNVSQAQLVRLAKGDKFGESFENMLQSFEALGLQDALNTVNERVYTRVREALMSKLEATLPQRLHEQAKVSCNVTIKDSADQARFFYDLVEAIEATTGGEQGDTSGAGSKA